MEETVEPEPLYLPQDEEAPTLKPLLTLPGRIPEGWKDAVYGRDGSGSASEDND